MTPKSLLYAALVATALALTAYGGYWYANSRPEIPTDSMQADSMNSRGDAQVEERKVLYWHDPMVPGQKFDAPGRSPFMDMDLVPVYGDEVSGTAIRINPALSQSLGVRSVEATMGTFWRRVDTVGTIQADERRITVVQSRAAGWMERLHVRAVNDPVRRGAAIAEIYAPDLRSAQEEYLLLLNTSRDNDKGLLSAARERLSLLGLSESQISQLESSRKTTRRIVLHAPSSGIVTELAAREGAAVSPGMAIASITDLSRVWIIAEVPEINLAWIRQGRPAEARISAREGELFEGRIEYIYPDVNPVTRTVKARFSVENRNLALRPGMVADVTLYGGPKREVLLVPGEAVIRTGTRNVVVIEEQPGQFRAQEVEIGLESGEKTEITRGLMKGERVVISGQFLIDSEANLKGALARLEPSGAEDEQTHDGHSMSPVSAPESMGQITEHLATGRVATVDAALGKLVITHRPVASLGWPEMTMGFPVKDLSLLSDIKPGDEIEFRFVKEDNVYPIVAIARQRGSQP